MATATPPPATYHLCSYKVQTGEQEYVLYELREDLTEEEYTRELLEFCLETQGEDAAKIAENMKRIEDEGFSEWAYDDRIYSDPWVQDISKEEYKVLRKYLLCR